MVSGKFGDNCRNVVWEFVFGNIFVKSNKIFVGELGTKEMIDVRSTAADLLGGPFRGDMSTQKEGS